MPFARTLIDPTYDREWIARTGNFHSHASELEDDGRWFFSAANVEQALALIDEYPVRYLEKRRPEAKIAIEGRAQAAFAVGYTHADGPLADHTLQCRDTEDRTNWLTSQVSYSAAIAQGAGDLPGATFRTEANETVGCTYAEGSAVLLGMAQWGASIMGRAWALKDAAAAAANIGELDAVMAEIDSGWPATAVV